MNTVDLGEGMLIVFVFLLQAATKCVQFKNLKEGVEYFEQNI